MKNFHHEKKDIKNPEKTAVNIWRTPPVVTCTMGK